MTNFTSQEYLKDLLKFSRERVKFTADGTVPGNIDIVANQLTAALRQAFDQLILPEHHLAGLQSVQHTRVAIEILRNYLLSLQNPPNVATADKHYVQNAYQLLLANLGTSFEEIRLVHSASDPERKALSERLGLDQAARLDGLLIKLNDLSEKQLATIFGLVSTTRDPFNTKHPQPQLLKWRMDYLRGVWKTQDHQNPPSEHQVMPIIDPDLVDENMIVNPDETDERMFIDSDLIDMDVRQGVFDLWLSRRNAVKAMIEDVQARIKEAFETKNTLREAYSHVLTHFFANVNLDSALTSRTEGTPDPHEDANRVLASLELGALRRLVQLEKLARAGKLTDVEWNDPAAPNSEWTDITAILVQFRKQQEYAKWQAEEKDVFLGPDFFKLPDPTIRSTLVRWRTTRQTRIQWEDRLRARIQQRDTTVQALQSAVDATERVALIELRDALIGALAVQTGRDMDLVADQLTTRLLIDFKNRDGRTTTRIAQAIETLQALFFALRMGRSIKTDLPDDSSTERWTLRFEPEKPKPHKYLEADFDMEWRWLGTYATRRAVEFVKDYPENYLLPTLQEKSEPTTSFWHLIDNLRRLSRLTPDAARKLANTGFGDADKPDKPNLGYLQHLRLQSGSLPTGLPDDFIITDQITDFAGHRQLVEKLFDAQKQNGKLKRDYMTDDGQVIRIDDPHQAPNWLQEIFYFVPMAIALQLHRSGEYLAALDWYQTVYAYQLPRGGRKIYHGLELERVFSDRPRITPGIWLRTELNPHSFARQRKDAYTRFTILSIVQCLLDYADLEFTLETPESLPRARALYLSALNLLELEEVPKLNPVIRALRQRAQLSLDKLRNGRNIAGMERPPEREPAGTTTQGDLADMPVIGTGGQLVVRSSTPFRPTPYRYAALIERAKQLVTIAQQMEAAFQASLEKRDTEAYNLFRARQDLALSQVTIQLQDLRVTEAASGVTLASLQQDRAEIQSDTFQEWIDAGLNQWEETMIRSYEEAGAAQSSIAFYEAGIQMAQAWTTAATAGPTGAPAAAAGAFAVAAAAAQRSAASSRAIRAQTKSQLASVQASQERRQQEWRLQKQLAEQDIQIAGQQIIQAVQRKGIAEQERRIASTQAEHAVATVDFLANKKMNVEMYEWMTGVLTRVYSYFLQQATAMAHLAQNQLAFERQGPPPTFVQADYWQAPVEQGSSSGANGNAPDRQGLTGSARLLQDIYQLDQYAFETNKRKLQLSQAFSLARLFPLEFQRFRESGVLPFATPLDLFDRGFPGHYLRLIKRVRMSVIALVPPTQGIRATLTASGISRVVVGPDVFRTIEVRRTPDLIAFTSPNNATGMFELEPAGDMLLPFEGMGVDTTWRLEMPRAANPFDYRTIADVIMTVDYTALHSFDYRQQVIQRLDTRMTGERSFSVRDEFADAWYQLHNPEQVDEPDQMVVRFETSRADFPPNIENLAIDHVLLYFARVDSTEDGEALPEVQVEHLHFRQANREFKGGNATSIDGLISTRRANGTSWVEIVGMSPVGEWELALPNTDEIKNLFKNEKIEDIKIEDMLFVITYSGRTPAWPQ